MKKLGVQGFGKQKVATVHAIVYAIILHCFSPHSLTLITNVIYITTFPPVVYWIFLSNYFRLVHFVATVC